MVSKKIKSNRDVNLDAVKGFLILCIILEHNTLLVAEYHWIRPFCDSFAAGTFLILTFIWPLKYLNSKDFFDRYFSYYIPFIVFVSLTSIINYFFYGQETLSQSFYYYLRAVFFASPYEIKQSSGFMYLWFLPCLSFLYLLRFILQKTSWGIYVIALSAILFIGTIDEDILVKTPYSLHVIGFIFLLGLIYSKIHSLLNLKNIIFRLFLMGAFSLFSMSSNTIGWNLFLAPGIIPSWNEPFLLLYYSLFMLVSIPGIYSFMSLLPLFIVSFFAYIGNQSLKIYLIHPLVFILMTQIIPLVTHPLLSYILTIIITTCCAFLISKLPNIERLIFPSRISVLLKQENR